MSDSTGTVYPPVSWAQRSDLIYVIIDVECKDIDHKVTDNSFTFKGVNALDSTKKYDVTLNFYHAVDPTRVTCKNIGRCLEFTIYKKESGPFWPSLTSGKTKLHFLKANFTKWKNESDDEDAIEMGDSSPFENLMGGGESNWNNKFDDIDLEDNDSDDNIPSLSQNDDDEGEEKPEKKTEEGKSAKEEK